jgi:glycine/D-amino acid oxidase-like deaminating enzyme/nitrite reductase/ring-hydroxylating ferredoxin subunit
MKKTISIWEDTAAEISSFPALTSDKEADVVIIGGGITGLTTAMLLTDAGKKVIVLEAWKIGLGTTGNSTGNLYVTVDEHLSTIKKKWSAEVMKAIVNSRSEALNLIESTINKYNLDCDFYRTSFNYFAESLDKEIETFIENESEALTESGLTVNTSNNPSPPFYVNKSISVDGQAQFHPLKYIRALAEVLKNKCEIYENSQVLDFDEDKGIVKTNGGTVKAKHVVMATHTPKGVYMLHTVLGPYREFGIAAELLSGEMPRGIFWGMNKPKHSVRCFKNGDKNYVMVIGDKYKTGQGDNTNEYIERLEEFLRTHFNAGPVTHVWGGQHYRAADGLPYIGKHKESVYFLTGFATDGLVYGTLASMIVSDMILGKKNLWEETYKLSRFTPLKSFKEFFKENADNVVQYLKDVPWNTDADSLKEVPAGEGRIIEKHGEKLAVYKDELGTIHVCSAVCTHMKCVVNWNPAEKTWDCPCHGSRFKTDGQVIEGPAVINLPSKKI